eukprot:maker-scaffold_20-snap-gene-0.43-mRNA-1 protein AED:0.16 eAED:0.44 QI:129/0/0.5/1/0/0/2/0/444
MEEIDDGAFLNIASYLSLNDLIALLCINQQYILWRGKAILWQTFISTNYNLPLSQAQLIFPSKAYKNYPLSINNLIMNRAFKYISYSFSVKYPEIENKLLLHRSVFSSKFNGLFIFGGQNSSGATNQVLFADIISRSISVVKNSGDILPRLSSGGFATHPKGFLIYFGGNETQTIRNNHVTIYSNTLFIGFPLSYSEIKWFNLTPEQSAELVRDERWPEGRQGTTLVEMDEKFYLFGGSKPEVEFCDVWEFEIDAVGAFEAMSKNKVGLSCRKIRPLGTWPSSAPDLYMLEKEKETFTWFRINASGDSGGVFQSLRSTISSYTSAHILQRIGLSMQVVLGKLVVFGGRSKFSKKIEQGKDNEFIYVFNLCRLLGAEMEQVRGRIKVSGDEVFHRIRVRGQHPPFLTGHSSYVDEYQQLVIFGGLKFSEKDYADVSTMYKLKLLV